MAGLQNDLDLEQFLFLILPHEIQFSTGFLFFLFFFFFQFRKQSPKMKSSEEIVGKTKDAVLNLTVQLEQKDKYHFYLPRTTTMVQLQVSIKFGHKGTQQMLPIFDAIYDKFSKEKCNSSQMCCAILAQKRLKRCIECCCSCRFLIISVSGYVFGVVRKIHWWPILIKSFIKNNGEKSTFSLFYCSHF